ncbi:MAG: hypothetical protein EXR81_03860 [Gammaproteobacteria bacterium]|nr:hypothetical protein [Gammaproteobacteria bacterium]
MIRIREYAAISGHVYQPNTNNYMEEKFAFFKSENLKDRKTVDGWKIIQDVDPHTNSANNFFAALYIKFSNGEATDAVIAMRGTMPSNFNNIITDVLSWYSAAIGTNWHNHLPAYVADVAEFTHLAIDYLEQHFPTLHETDIRFTGHSLGGALAQIMALRCHYYPCVSFNSPSCRGMMNERVGQVLQTRSKSSCMYIYIPVFSLSCASHLIFLRKS